MTEKESLIRTCYAQNLCDACDGKGWARLGWCSGGGAQRGAGEG